MKGANAFVWSRFEDLGKVLQPKLKSQQLIVEHNNHLIIPEDARILSDRIAEELFLVPSSE